jgi:hypothetical protein
MASPLRGQSAEGFRLWTFGSGPPSLRGGGAVRRSRRLLPRGGRVAVTNRDGARRERTHASPSVGPAHAVPGPGPVGGGSALRRDRRCSSGTRNGGALLTNVPADAGEIVALASIAGYALNPGESCGDGSALAPGGSLAETLERVPFPTAAWTGTSHRTGSTGSSPKTCPSGLGTPAKAHARLIYAHRRTKPGSGSPFHEGFSTMRQRRRLGEHRAELAGRGLPRRLAGRRVAARG